MISEKCSKAAYICRNRGGSGYWIDFGRSGCEVGWKGLATPHFMRRAEIGGGELMNIGWEWGVPVYQFFKKIVT